MQNPERVEEGFRTRLPSLDFMRRNSKWKSETCRNVAVRPSTHFTQRDFAFSQRQRKYPRLSTSNKERDSME